MTQYKCKHFKIQELVSKRVYKDRGDKAWELLDARALETLDVLREHLDVSLTVNNWLWEGPRQFSGLRTYGTKYYSKYSQHSFGRAFDVVSNHITAEDMRQEILNNQEVFPHVGAIELGVSWLHFDVRNARGEGKEIFTFYP